MPNKMYGALPIQDPTWGEVGSFWGRQLGKFPQTPLFPGSDVTWGGFGKDLWEGSPFSSWGEGYKAITTPRRPGGAMQVPATPAAAKPKTYADWIGATKGKEGGIGYKNPYLWKSQQLGQIPWGAGAMSPEEIGLPEMYRQGATDYDMMRNYMDVFKQAGGALGERESRLFDEQMKSMTAVNALLQNLSYNYPQWIARPEANKRQLAQMQPMIAALPGLMQGMSTIAAPMKEREAQIKELETMVGLSLTPATRAKLMGEAMEWKPRTMEEAFGLAGTTEGAKAQTAMTGGFARGMSQNFMFLPPELQKQIMGTMFPGGAMGPVGSPTVDKETFISAAVREGATKSQAEKWYKETYGKK